MALDTDDQMREKQRQLIAIARDQAAGVRLSEASDETTSSVAGVRCGSGNEKPAGDTLPGPALDSFTGYLILGELHRGGQGIVFEAIQKATRRKVAIKVMKEGPFAGPIDKARFDREIQILAQVRHPNIVTIHGTGVAAGHHYFVMDYVHGQPLDVYVASQKRSVDAIVRLFVRITEAVNAAHLRGIIHRDLKPSNIRINDAGEPHVLDFGLAKSGMTDTELVSVTATGQFIGSLPWASPEQGEGSPSMVDVRTDVYSLGVILYQMLTGTFPYSVVGGMREVLERIARAEPVRPSLSHRQINDEIETIVLKCLEKEPERRYQNAGELARDLRHYLSGEPIEAKRDSTVYVLRKKLRKHRITVAFAAALLLTLLGGLITSAIGWRQAAEQRDDAEAARAQADAVTEFLVEALRAGNPYAGPGPGATIGKILNEAATRVEDSFEDQPLVRAAVYESLSYQYDALGFFPEAQATAKKALELRRARLPADHPEVATSLRQCAQAASGIACYPEAETLARESLEMRLRLYGRKHEAVQDSLVSLGVALAAQGKYAEAEPVFREAAAHATELWGMKHRGAIEISLRHTACLLEQGRLAEARPILAQVVSLGRDVFGPETPQVASALASYGEALYLNGEFDAAESAHRESLAIRRKVFGDAHITIANSLSNLALLLVDEARYEEAEPLYEQSLDLRRRLYGPRRVEVTYALNGLARLYNRTGRPAEAEVLLRESLSIFNETVPRHWRRAYAECLLAAALMLQARFEEADPLIAEGVDGVRAARGDRDVFAREVLGYAVDFYNQLDRPEEAAALARVLEEE